MSNILKSLALACVSVLLSFLAIELYVRVIVDDGMNYELEMWKYAKQMKHVSDDLRIGHEHQPNRQARLMGVDISINSTKLRDKEISLQKPADTIRILMLGDSITFGWGVAATDRVSRRLETKLNSWFPMQKFEVVNAGVGNYNTAMEVSWFLLKGQTFDPDLVILNYFVNDAELTPKRRGGLLRVHSAAYVYLANRVDTARRSYAGSDWHHYYQGLYAPGAVGWEVAREHIRTLANVCHESGIKLAITSYPELHQLAPYPFMAVDHALQKLAYELKIPFINLLPAVAGDEPQTLWVTSDDAHPNAIANQKFARRLAGELKYLVGSWLTK